MKEVDEFKQYVIEDNAQVYCPVTLEPIDYREGEVILCKDFHYFVSDEGIKILKKMFGNNFIQQRIIK